MADIKLPKTLLVVSGIGGIFLAMTQISATEAISNIESWLILLGINTKGYDFKNVDTTISIISVVVTPCVRIDVAFNKKNRERRRGDRWESTQRNTEQ